LAEFNSIARRFLAIVASRSAIRFISSLVSVSGITAGARLLGQDELTDEDVKAVIRDAGEGQRRTRAVAEVLDGFDQFCRAWTTKEVPILLNAEMNQRYDRAAGVVELPAPLGPVD